MPHAIVDQFPYYADIKPMEARIEIVRYSTHRKTKKTNVPMAILRSPPSSCPSLNLGVEKKE